MALLKDCTRCPRVFKKPHKYTTLCPKCRQELKENKEKGVK